MYQEIILSVLIILIIFYVYNYDTRVEVEAFSQKYKVRPLKPGDSPDLLQKKSYIFKRT